MKKQTILIMILLVILTTTIVGWAQQQGESQTPQITASQQADTIMVSTSSLGNILVDSQGKTLYYFYKDIPASNASTCSGQCATIWPVFSVDSIEVSPPLAASDFAIITRDDGSTQVTYHGWPLYHYQGDANPGDVNGENVLNLWSVVRPDETVMISQQGNLGSFLTDNMGKTLYFFANDTPMKSVCSGNCATKWIPFNVEKVVAPSILNASAFDSMTRDDGMNQTMFMGRPLYYYVGDKMPGNTMGQGVNNVWFVANISGSMGEMTVIPTTVPPTMTTTVAPTIQTMAETPAPTMEPPTAMPYSSGYSSY